MLRLLRRRELPWYRRLQARFRDVDGIVIIGDVHGVIRQLAGRGDDLWQPEIDRADAYDIRSGEGPF